MPVLNNPHDNKELIQIRESQDDPIVQYYIVKKSLNMTEGKIAAQCSHGAMMFFKYHSEKRKEMLSKTPRGGKEWSRSQLTEKWLNGSFRKVILKAQDSKFEKIKEEFDCFLVRDAGLTEVESGSETVLVLFPMHKSKVPNIIQKLRVL